MSDILSHTEEISLIRDIQLYGPVLLATENPLRDRSYGVICLAGCGQFTGTRTELAAVQAFNPYYGTERIDIRIEQADEIVVEETLSVVQGNSPETVACFWERDGDNPIIAIRLADGSDWYRLNLADADDETVLV